jgi:2-polyprenyl-6-methoxyphenol hydroxylase-like FAD-dependent oxidoreductase
MLATFGQGANMAFEDAYVLAQWLRSSDDDEPAALNGYEAVRKPSATRVQKLSRTELRFKKRHNAWERLHREAIFLSRHGSATVAPIAGTSALIRSRNGAADKGRSVCSVAGALLRLDAQ